MKHVEESLPGEQSSPEELLQSLLRLPRNAHFAVQEGSGNT